MSVTVVDPFDVAADPDLPDAALDPRALADLLVARVAHLAPEGSVRLSAVRVTRHKPGRRCLIEYDLELETPDRAPRRVTLVGKVRARRPNRSSFHCSRLFWETGFDSESVDGISVPEPIAHVPELHLWLQRKVAGQPATALLRGGEGEEVARRIAEAAVKVHRAGVPTLRRHTAADELTILHTCLGNVAAVMPQWSERLARLFDACVALADDLHAREPIGIHRDFYADQVLVDGVRLHLVDFDLYCLGDAALDAGNFLGHVREQALRERGDADAYTRIERAFEDRFVELEGEEVRAALAAYTTLTLARHVYLSQLFPDRRRTTAALLALCESRLRLTTSSPSPLRPMARR